MIDRPHAERAADPRAWAEVTPQASPRHPAWWRIDGQWALLDQNNDASCGYAVVLTAANWDERYGDVAKDRT